MVRQEIFKIQWHYRVHRLLGLEHFAADRGLQETSRLRLLHLKS